MMRLVVESWRFLPHSYSIVNHFQCAALARRADVELFHADAPYLVPAWQPVERLLSPESDDAVRAIPAPPPDLEADAWLSLRAPYRLDPAPQSRRTFSFGTCEYGVVPPPAVAGPEDKVPNLSGAPVTFITPSNWSREGYIRCGVKSGNVIVIPHGVEPTLFRPAASESEVAALRTELGWPEASFVFLNIGAMLWNKGISALLVGFAAVLEKHPSALLVLKGTDSMYGSGAFVRGWLAGLGDAAARRVRERIVYVGDVLTIDHIAKLHRAADAYVCPYRAEGFNLPALEAAASGLPVLCTAGGPTDDFVRPEFSRKIKADLRRMAKGSVGFYLEPGVESVAGQMLAVMADRRFREEARTAGPAHVRSGYTWDQIAGRLVEAMSR